MLVIRERAETRLVLGPHRLWERCALIALVLGLFMFGCGLAAILTGELAPAASVLLILALPPIVVSGPWLCGHERWVFDRARGHVAVRRLLRRRRRLELAAIESVELWETWLGYRRLTLLLKDGTRLEVCATRYGRPGLLKLARELADFLQAPLEQRRVPRERRASP
jgi:hypothetical protein